MQLSSGVVQKLILSCYRRFWEACEGNKPIYIHLVTAWSRTNATSMCNDNDKRTILGINRIWGNAMQFDVNRLTRWGFHWRWCEGPGSLSFRRRLATDIAAALLGCVQATSFPLDWECHEVKYSSKRYWRKMKTAGEKGRVLCPLSDPVSRTITLQWSAL